MGREVKITIGTIKLEARLNETNTATSIRQMFPIISTVNLLGKEIYSAAPLELGLENPQEMVTPEDISYCPQGKAVCLLFGQTPISTSEEISIGS